MEFKVKRTTKTIYHVNEYNPPSMYNMCICSFLGNKPFIRISNGERIVAGASVEIDGDTEYDLLKAIWKATRKATADYKKRMEGKA